MIELTTEQKVKLIVDKALATRPGPKLAGVDEITYKSALWEIEGVLADVDLATYYVGSEHRLRAAGFNSELNQYFCICDCGHKIWAGGPLSIDREWAQHIEKMVEKWRAVHAK